MTDFDLVVIGAGPAGSVAATGFAKAGWRVALIERATFPRRKVCGEFLSATSVAVLDAVSAAPAWRAEAGPSIRRLALYSGSTIRTSAAPGKSEDGFGRALGRDRLDVMLVEAARSAGVTLYQPARAVTVTHSAKISTVVVATEAGVERSITTRLVIAAHGSWEPGPLQSQLPRQNAPSDHLGFKAYFRDTRLDADLMPLLVFPGGYGGVVTADAGRVSLSLCIRRDRLELLRRTSPGSAGDAVHAHLLTSCRGVHETIGAARLDGSWLAAGPIRPGIRRRWANGVLRVGNVAGEAHPIIAEGISMAVQSGWLAAKVFEGVDPQDRAAIEGAALRYAEDWRRRFSTRIRAAHAFSALAENPISRFLAETAIRKAPRLLGLGARLAGKVQSPTGENPADRSA